MLSLALSRIAWWQTREGHCGLPARTRLDALSHCPLLLEADKPPVADDHVVQEVDAEELGGLGRVLGQLHVLRRWRRVPRRMVVDQDDVRRVGDDGVTEQLRHAGHRRRVNAALV